MGRNQAIVAALAAAVLALAGATTLLYLDGDRADVELAALESGLADRDDEVTRLRAELAEAEEQRRAFEQRISELEAASDRVEVLEAELEASAAAAADEAEPGQQGSSEVDGAEQPAAAPPEPAASDAAAPSEAEPGAAAAEPDLEPITSACDELGGFHDLGEEACARLIDEMASCWDEVLNDPKWVQGDGPYYEHVDTGELTICDL
jgi:TolA-binding protein